MNLTIFKKGLILVSVPLLFQLAFLGLVAEMQSSNAEAQEWYTHTKEVLSQAQTVLGCLVDGQNGIRGFILSGDPSFRRPYEAAARELPEALQQLQTFVGDNPGQLAKAGRVAAQASQLMSWYAEIDSLVRTGSSDQATARIKDGAGKRQLEAVRLEIDSFLEEERRLDGERKQALEHARQRFNGLLRAGGAVSLCTTVALAVVFSRGISGRLATLIEKAGRLARGQELSPPLAGSDEVAQLDRAFHRMATELARSGEELRKQTRILQSVLDSIGDGVNVADEQGRFLVFNPAAEQILRVGRTDGRPDEWTERYGVYLPDRVTLYPANELPLARAMRGEAVDAEELFIRNAHLPSGVWVSVTARPLKDEEGVSRGGVVVFRDITERKRAEDAIRQLNDELERRVLERTAELAEANRDLTQKNQENEMFVYSVSHDLRSPLVNLEGFSSELGMVCRDLRSLLEDERLPPTLRERGLALLDGDMAEATRFIQTGVLRMSRIIDALLRLSRAGRVEYQWQRVDVNATVARVVESMSATIAQRGASVTVADLPPAWGDPTAVEQVFANLIGNALNYLDPTRPGVIEVGCSSPAEDLNEQAGSHRYFVGDNGLGIPEPYRRKVFQVFQRFHAGVAPGEGIGLAMVRRIVERHQGRIWLESVEGEGSTFSLTLPAANLTPDGLGPRAVCRQREEQLACSRTS